MLRNKSLRSRETSVAEEDDVKLNPGVNVVYLRDDLFASDSTPIKTLQIVIIY